MNHDEFVAAAISHYRVTLLWQALDDSGEPLDETYTVDDVEDWGPADRDIEEFINRHWDDLCDLDPLDVGHNFALNRNGHGTGFWDKYPTERGILLSEVSREFGEQDLLITEEGTLSIYP